MKTPFLIIGPGALGTGLAAEIQKAGGIPRCLGRTGPVTLETVYEEPWDNSITLSLRTLESGAMKTVHTVFIAVKAHQLDCALKQHLPILPAGSAVIPVGNGAVDKILVPYVHQFSRLKWRLGTSTLAISSREGKFVSQNRNGEVRWGPLFPEANDLTEGEKFLTAGGNSIFEGCFHWEKRPELNYRKKWLFNTVLNTLIAGHGLSQNGEATSRSLLLEKLFSEALLLGERMWGIWPTESGALFQELLLLIEMTKDNENSMARDLRLKRETESSFLAGLAVDYDDLPNLRELHERISGM